MTNPTTAARPSEAPNEDTISVIEIVNAVLRNWRVVMVLPLVLAIVVGAWSLTREHTFAATASFVPQVSEGRGLSGAAALAQQFGVSLGTNSPGQSPQFYEDLLRTSAILRRAVEAEYDLPSRGGAGPRGTLLEYWNLEAEKKPLPAWRRGVTRLKAAISTSVRRETGVIELRVSSDQPLLAEQIAAKLLLLLNDFNLDVRQTRARDESKFINDRLADVQRELGSAEDALEKFLRQNRDFRNSPELTFQHDRLQRQVMARQEVYASLLSAQEQARIDGMRDTPVLQIIDSPAGTALVESRKVALRAVIAFLVGILLAVGLATLREAGRRGRLASDPHYREFEDLVWHAWGDLRHPHRWINRKKKSDIT